MSFLLPRPAQARAFSICVSLHTSYESANNKHTSLHSAPQSATKRALSQQSPRLGFLHHRPALLSDGWDFSGHMPGGSTATCRRYSTVRNVVRSPCKNIVVPGSNLSEYVWEEVDNWPDKTAVVCGISGRSYTYRELRNACSRFAGSLRKSGFKPGEVLAIVLPNSPEYPIAMLGAVEAGMLVTTVNPIYVPAEISKQLVDSNARVIVTLPEMFAQVEEATRLAAEHSYKKPMIIVTESIVTTDIPQGAVRMREMIDNTVDTSKNTPYYSVTRETPVVIPYSSGTTGLPKGVLLSHRNLIANMLQLQDEKIALAEPAYGNYQDSLPAILPFYHIYGMVVVLLSKLRLGAKVVTLPKFEPTTFLDAIQNHRSTVLYLVPPLILFLGSSPAATTEHFKSVRYLLSGAAPLGAKDMERFLAKAPDTLQCFQGYGLTETSPVVFHPVIYIKNGVRVLPAYGLTEASPTIFHTETSKNKLSSVGQCVSNTSAKIVNQAGEALGPNEVGEVIIKGPQVMLGYHNNPKATSDMLDKDGWLHTGDLGYYDEDNDFYIVDRLKELIKVKGMQVAPAELEELLRSHPDVQDAAVIGIPDERSGEVPLGYIVPKPNVSPKKLEEDLKTFVESKVSKFKHLAGGIRIVETIPKSPAGKILRKILREQYKKEKEGNN